MVKSTYFDSNNKIGYYESILEEKVFNLKNSCLCKYYINNNIITIDPEIKLILDESENNDVNSFRKNTLSNLIKMYKILMKNNNCIIFDIMGTINVYLCNSHLIEYQCVLIAAIYEKTI